MTQIEKMITRSGSGCITKKVIDGKVYFSSPCAIVGELQVALSKASQTGSIIDFLVTNDFKCLRVIDETKCRNEFKVIVSPASDATGRTLRDIEETFITEVAFKLVKPGPLSVEDIMVEFTHLSKLLHDYTVDRPQKRI
jgi:hypothetical protein